MSEYPDLTTFKALSFDCYGTLVDYEASLRRHLEPLRKALPSSHLFAQDATQLMQRFNAISDELEHKHGDLRTDKLLVEAFQQLLSELSVEESSLPPSAVEDWRSMAANCDPFPDTIEGLQILKRRLGRLIILSNVDERNIAITVSRMEPAQFDAVYTAEKIGSYKPSHRNFEYLFRQAKEDFGVDADKGEILHVARSLKADHVPAKELGLRSVWIARGGDTKQGQGIGGDSEAMKAKLGFEWKFQSIGEFAKEVERQFSLKESSRS